MAASSSAWPHVIVLDPFNAGLAVARRMVRLGAKVSVVEGQSIVGRSRGVRGVIEPYKASGGRWLEIIHALAAESEEAVVLTATDRASAWLVGAAGSLPSNLRLFEHPGSAHLALMNKREADAIARRAGVRVPWTARFAADAQFERLAVEAPWPCVVKPVLSHAWRDRFGEKRSFFAENAVQARAVISAPLREGFEMLLSQYIPGEDSDVEEAIVVRLADGSYPVQFGCRKLRQYPAGFGETAVGESSALRETTALAKRVLDEAGFVGVAGVETKRHAGTGERWFLEVNVRLPGQWGLGDACGARATPRLIEAMQGRVPGAPPAIESGVRFVQPDLDWHSIAPTLRALPPPERLAAAWRLARPYLGAGERGVFELSDPGPLIALARKFLGRRISRPLKRPIGTRASAGHGDAR